MKINDITKNKIVFLALVVISLAIMSQASDIIVRDGDMIVNNDVLYVDSGKGWVGIGTSSPLEEEELYVIGNTILNNSEWIGIALTLIGDNDHLLINEFDNDQSYMIESFSGDLRIRDETNSLDIINFNGGGGIEIVNSGVCVDDDTSCIPPTVGDFSIVDGGLCVDSDGSCTPPADGHIKAYVIDADGHSDVAEMIEVANQDIEETDVVCIDSNNPTKVTYCSGAYDTTVVGIISSMNASLIANSGCGGRNTIPLYDENETLIGYDDDPDACDTFRPIALKGNVPVKVDCSTPIEAGDLLVSASTQGYAQSVQAVTPTSWQQVWNNLGSPLAKALEDCEQGTSVIRAWVM